MTQPTNSRLAWFNGKFMPENQVLISFRDRSWKFGDGVFDMTRTFNGRAFRLKEHIDRFYRSLRYLRLDPGMSPQEMIEISEQLLACNEHLRAAVSDWWVGQRVSRGVDPLDDEAPGPRSPNIVLEGRTPLPLWARARQFRDGLDVWTPAERRIAPDMLSPRAKTHNYLNMIVAEQFGQSARSRRLGVAARRQWKSRGGDGQQHLRGPRRQSLYPERALRPRRHQSPDDARSRAQARHSGD